MELSALSLHTADRESARDCASDQDADIRFRVKHEVAMFIRPCRQVAAEYFQTQQRRADTGKVSRKRLKNFRNQFTKALENYVGSRQIHMIGKDSSRTPDLAATSPQASGIGPWSQRERQQQRLRRLFRWTARKVQ